jgi:hypothetical protein
MSPAIINFKYLLLNYVLLSTCFGAVVIPRSPQHSHGAQSNDLPLNGLLSKLDEKDMAAALKSNLPRAKLAKTEVSSPKLRNDAKRLSNLFGPYTLEGKNVSKETIHRKWMR